MKQEIPQAMNAVVAFVAKLVRGLDLFEIILGVKQNTKTAVSADLAAAESAQAEAQDARTARKTALANRNVADTKLIIFIGVLRELLKPKFGPRYSQTWNQVGFLNNTLALPRTMNGRVGLVRAAQLHLETHPELEIPGVLTAEIAGTVYTEAVTATSELGIAQATARQKMSVRDAAMASLQKRARHLFQELRQLLPANDPRWLEFGYNVPGDVPVPSAPEGVTVTPGVAGQASLKWNHTVYADRFHLFQQVVGIDADPVKIGTVTETAKDLNDLPPGAHVKFYLTAVNATGESMPSEVVEVVVPQGTPTDVPSGG